MPTLLLTFPKTVYMKFSVHLLVTGGVGQKCFAMSLIVLGFSLVSTFWETVWFLPHSLVQKQIICPLVPDRSLSHNYLALD